MRKSPLSTPGGSNRGNFHGGRGRKRGYSQSPMRNANDNFYQFAGPSHANYDQAEGDMIPLNSGSPTFHHNRGKRRQTNHQRFSSTATSGSYNYNNQRSNLQNSPGSPYSPQNCNRNQRQQNSQNNGHHNYRTLPVSNSLDIRLRFVDPWAELEKELVYSKSEEVTKPANNSSVEIVYDRYELQNSSSESTFDENTINISSSCDEIKEQSSVELPLENTNFSRDSKDGSISHKSSPSQDQKSFDETTSKSQEDSVVEIVYS